MGRRKHLSNIEIQANFDEWLKKAMKGEYPRAELGLEEEVIAALTAIAYRFPNFRNEDIRIAREQFQKQKRGDFRREEERTLKRL